MSPINISVQSMMHRQPGHSSLKMGGVLCLIASLGSQVTPSLLTSAITGNVSLNHLETVTELRPNIAAMDSNEMFDFIFINTMAIFSLLLSFLGAC